jgi:hypothetical protein
MWIAGSGPSFSVPLCGEGIEKSTITPVELLAFLARR